MVTFTDAELKLIRKLTTQPAQTVLQIKKSCPVHSYCNPLPLEASSRDGSPQGVSLGDVTVVREGDLYYLFGITIFGK